ncbi:MAG: helix-turn-helix transcriptional regulator [Clostridia bacterium]|jgi:transcriptional regulator, XRE family|nr:helix-turn-helix transcriptional regulator [Clostridia bacterium]
MAVNIGKNILESMKVKGITQTELAKLLGVKQNTVSQWINGVNEPNCQTIVKLCYVLEITPNEIFGWKD